MAKYVCTNLIGNVCTQWEQYDNSSWLDALAITRQQADEIIISSLIVVFGAWAVRQVLNLILKRRY